MPLSVDLNYMWWNGWQSRLWGGGGVIGIIILPALNVLELRVRESNREDLRVVSCSCTDAPWDVRVCEPVAHPVIMRCLECLNV